MAVDATMLFREVDTIASEGLNRSNYNISCSILAGGEWITPLRLNLESLERDFERGFADVRVIEFLMALGDYTYKLIPNRDNLLIDLKFTPMFEAGGGQADEEIRTLRFRGILIDQDNQAMAGKHSQATDAAALDRLPPRSVQLQLVDEASYQVLMLTLNPNFRKISPMDALRAILTMSMDFVKGSDTQRILGINTVPGFNTEPRNQITIPHGTPLKQIPDLLQNQDGGVYATGLGCYLQNQYWYLFPLYDTTRFIKTPRSLTVLNVPSNRYFGAERTYRTTNQQIIVLATGNVAVLDTTAFDYLNAGNGLRFADARRLLTTFGVTDNNRMLIDRASNLFEVSAEKMKTDVNNFRWSDDRITSNPFKHYTAIAQKKGAYVNVEWMHGDSNLLYPGMPVKFLTVQDNALKTYEGVLLGLHQQRIPAEIGAVAIRYPSKVTLKLFLDRSIEEAE